MARWIGFFVGVIIASGLLIGIGVYDADRLQTLVKQVKDTLVVTEEPRELNRLRNAFDISKAHVREQKANVAAPFPDETKSTTNDSVLIINQQQTFAQATHSNSPVPEVISNVNTALSDVSHQQLPTDIENRKVNATGPASVIHKWYPVWQPFRSELSAIGFADHLTRLTQHEYRVRRLSAWTYLVEFAYYAETEITETLQDIETKAGVVLKQSP